MLNSKNRLILKVALVVTVILYSISACIAQPAVTEYSVLREISISDYGYALYNDTYVLERSTLDWIRDSGGEWFVGFPSGCNKNLGNAPLYPVAYVHKGEYLNLSRENGEKIVWYAIDLSPVIQDSLNNLTLHFEIFFTGIIVQNESYSSNLVVYVVDQSAYKVQGGPSISKITVSNNTYFEYLPRFFSYIEGSNKTIIEQSATTYSDPIDCKVKIVAYEIPKVIPRTLYKRLKFDQLLNLHVEEGYSLNFKTYIPEEIQIELPLNVYEVKTRDLTGPLEHTLKEDVNLSKTIISVKPRYAYWNVLGSYNSNYTFFVSYKLDVGSKIIHSEDKFTLPIDLLSSFYNFSQNTRIEIYLPLGANLDKISVNDFALDDIKKGDGFDYFEIFNATALILKGKVTLEFYYSLLWAGYTPGLTAGLIGLAVVMVVFPLKYRKKGLIEKVAVAGSALKEEFAREYINVLDLNKLIQDLHEDFVFGNVSRREYRSKQELLNNKLNASIKTLSQLKSRLQELGPPMADPLKELDALEAELQEARNSLREIRTLFLNRKISKKSYNELSEKYSQEIDDLTNRIIDFLKNL
ncbi:hypothetical protein KEJ17_01430 [Candidatus Bathyarchaeota archaeon]|nr:hypothetical protein [Candidatus Bathyarchaeota archaeon]